MSEPQRSALAVLTPPGRGGIAVIRCTGPAAEAALKSCFLPAAAPLPSAGALAYGHIVDADGRPLDEVILYRAAATTYEVNCHGGPAAVAAVCGRLAALGLEQVGPDELLEIEGVPPLARDARRMLRSARTPLAARVLLDQLDGALGGALARVDEALASGRTAEARADVGRLLAQWQSCGRFLADPPRIVIAGRPNAGKSTLLNRLVGTDRAITSPAPGTTRDYVEADAALEGLPVVLVDTAGLREARSGVERLGVQRAHEQTARAAVVVYLLDACEGAGAEDEAMLRRLGDRALAVWNKIDAIRPGGMPPLRISALTGEGVEALGQAILAHLGYCAPAAGDAVPFTAAQAAAMERARQAIDAGRADEARKVLLPLA